MLYAHIHGFDIAGATQWSEKICEQTKKIDDSLSALISLRDLKNLPINDKNTTPTQFIKNIVKNMFSTLELST
jgi:hypothetical protein